ncbi:hypothetical protein T06_7936 [Trichinella sp. T6]|nr:hypothetical protein T06_7936 [Trichinella sp. T6]
MSARASCRLHNSRQHCQLTANQCQLQKRASDSIGQTDVLVYPPFFKMDLFVTVHVNQPID